MPGFPLPYSKAETLPGSGVPVRKSWEHSNKGTRENITHTHTVS